MSVPKKLQLGHVTYDVVTDETQVAAIQLEVKEILYGYLQPRHQKLYINPNQGPDQMRDTVLHEVTHEAFPYGLVDEEIEEQIVRAVATNLLDYLRRNPKLVEFLCSA